MVDLFRLCLFLFLIGFFLPAFAPTLRWSKRFGFMGIQVLLLLIGLAAGWGLIAPMLWKFSGGCAAHGGSFEGACGYAGVAQSAVTAIFTAGILTSISGIALFRVGYKAKKQEGSRPPLDRGE